jgi:hypothetical protein
MLLKILKKSGLLFILSILHISCSSNAMGSGFDCNNILFYRCSNHNELWNGVNHSRVTNCLCPPYNKKARGGCLKQFPLPSPFDMIYNVYCAEESPSNNFFTPKIRVRVQTCNVGCWSLSDSLRGDGECKIYPGSFGVPLLRLCARLALPADHETETPADDGYTYGWNLNHEGAPTPDPVYDGDDNLPIYMARPKICAYWDPGLWDVLATYAVMAFSVTNALNGLVIPAGVTANIVREFVDSTGTSSGAAGAATSVLRTLQARFQPDTWDLNPLKQPSHFHQGGIFIVFQWIISLVKMGVTGASLVNSLIAMMPGDSMWYVYWIGVIYWLLVAIMYIGEEIIVPVLEYLGQLNNVVATSLGCVLIPLGPNPPPYCAQLHPAPSIPRVYAICPTIFDLVPNTPATVPTTYSLQLTTVPPTSQAPCVNSAQPNNIIHNSVRVGFDQLIPLCRAADIPSDRCVRIHDITLAPSSLHIRTNSLDIIRKICSGPNPQASELPCIESPNLLSQCRANTSLCGGGIRVVYATNGPREIINSYFDTEATDCNPLNNSMCQKIWGINIGDFKDLVVAFPAVESSYTDVHRDSAPAVLRDSDNSTVSVYARIVRKRTDLPLLMESDSMYVFDSFHNLVGSVARPVPPKPLVYECGGASAATCTSTFLNPAMVAKLTVGTYSTEGALSVKTSRNTGSKINLAGFDYDTFATDAQYSAIPFSGTHSIEPRSIYGTYQNNLAPYDSNGQNPTGAVYLRGLEYFDGDYVIGGEQLCLSGYQFDDCLTGKTNTSCILTSKINSNYIRCTRFINNIVSQYRGITLCNAAQLATYSQRATVSEPRLPPAVGNNIVTIYAESPTSSTYCYDYPGSAANGELCKIGDLINSRVSPPPSHVNPLSATNYYNYIRGASINEDLLSVRNKTAVEFGLCVDIPQPPSCPATNSAQASANQYATWPTTAGGNVGVGTCAVGAVPKSATSLQRNCLINRTTGNTSFAPLTASDGCNLQSCNATANSPFYSYNTTTKKLILSSGGRTTGGIYTYQFRFDLLSTALVNRFIIIKTGADDSIRIRVNGNDVAAAPGNAYTPGVEYGRYQLSSIADLDIKTNLVVGNNIIDITYSVQRAGEWDAEFTLDITGCSNLSIARP